MSKQEDYPEDSELGPRVVHYHQSKNGNGGSNPSALNNLLLVCLLAIIGFLGVQLWGINTRLAVVETNVATLLARP